MRPGLRVRIGDLGHARVGREAHRDRHLVLEMQRTAHARRLRARNELAEYDDAFGVGRPLPRLLAKRRVERIDERFGGRGHRGLLLCVHRRPPLERSLPPSFAPWILVFKLDLDAFLYLHRSCPCQTGQPSALFIFRVSAPDESLCQGIADAHFRMVARCTPESNLSWANCLLGPSYWISASCRH